MQGESGLGYVRKTIPALVSRHWLMEESRSLPEVKVGAESRSLQDLCTEETRGNSSLLLTGIRRSVAGLGFVFEASRKGQLQCYTLKPT